MNGINVLSLFDGISCGMIALERANIKVNNYYASEIEPNAIAISQNNYPNIIRLGDITKWKTWNIDYSSIDLILAGSPCQGFSFCGKQLNFDDKRSKLFFEFLDIYNHILKFNPNVKFLLENVEMKNEYKNVISQLLHCDYICIDSELITPMRRKRLYWCNWNVNMPQSKSTILKDILDYNVNDKYFLNEVKFNKLIEFKDNNLFIKNKDNRDLLVQENDGVILSRTWQVYMPLIKQKSHCIRSANPDDIGVCVLYNNQLRFRRFTLSEMERLQTLPVGYTNCVNESAAKKCIGNGWTVDIITHLLNCLYHYPVNNNKLF